MKLFKFKDKTEGNFCIIIAGNEEKAVEKMNSLTSLEFDLIDSTNEVKKEIVIYNKILPF